MTTKFFEADITETQTGKIIIRIDGVENIDEKQNLSLKDITQEYCCNMDLRDFDDNGGFVDFEREADIYPLENPNQTIWDVSLVIEENGDWSE